MAGKFITVEGQDGAGKSTNIEVIKQLIEGQGHALVCTREPGGTQLGEQLRDLILSADEQQMCDSAELLLMFAARAQHLAELIIPALEAQQWVLCDRFTDATYAYQGGGRGLDVTAIKILQELVQNSLQPDLTILLDVPVALGEQRAGERSAADRFEQQQQDFKQRVRNTYLQRAAAEPERIKLVDASGSIAEVSKAVTTVVNDFLERQL